MRRAFGLWLLLSGCGGAEPSAAVGGNEASSGAEVFARPRSGGMQISGILGTIPPRRIEQTMQAKLPALQRCFATGMGELAYLAGYIKFYFYVGLDGRVTAVDPRGTNIGHRPTEQCLLGVAKQVRFPEPKGGGPAEFSWGFELEPAGDVRAPVDWDESRASAALREQRASLTSCELGTAHYIVTLYVAPGGSVVSAGAAADSQAAADKIDCLLDAVQQWSMPDPGSYPAKVSFKL